MVRGLLGGTISLLTGREVARLNAVIIWGIRAMSAACDRDRAYLNFDPYLIPMECKTLLTFNRWFLNRAKLSEQRYK